MIGLGRAAARCAATAAALAAAMHPLVAQAEQPVITRSDATSIQLFPALPTSGCVQLFSFNFTIYERARRDSLGPGPSASLIVSGENTCTGRFFTSEGFADNITYLRNKESIQAQGTIPMTTRQDFTQPGFSEAVAFNVNVTVASTRGTRNWGTNHQTSGDLKLTHQFDSEFRPAIAAGSLSGTLFGASFAAGIDPAAQWFDDRQRFMVRSIGP